MPGGGVVVAAGAGVAFAGGAGVGAGPSMPPTTELGPRVPQIVKANAPTTKSTASTEVARVSKRGAGARAEHRLAAATAKRAGNVAAFALLQKDRDDQQPAHENV